MIEEKIVEICAEKPYRIIVSIRASLGGGYLVTLKHEGEQYSQGSATGRDLLETLVKAKNAYDQYMNLLRG